MEGLVLGLVEGRVSGVEGRVLGLEEGLVFAGLVEGRTPVFLTPFDLFL